MTVPENTTQRPAELHQLAMMGDGPTGYITGMEAAGQAQLVNSDVLPTDAPWAGHPGRRTPGESAPTLESLGFTRGDPVPGDPLFTHATLPPGWRREGSDHAMWSYITDDRGVRRVAVFYKAAWYDRSAHATIARPGLAAATDAIYSDGPPTLPALWDVLTSEERTDFRGALEDYLSNADEHPTIYGDRAPRVRALAALTEEESR